MSFYEIGKFRERVVELPYIKNLILSYRARIFFNSPTITLQRLRGVKQGITIVVTISRDDDIEGSDLRDLYAELSAGAALGIANILGISFQDVIVTLVDGILSIELLYGKEYSGPKTLQAV